MMMEKPLSALVVLVPQAEALAGAIRARHDPVAAHGMPPHVTVLFPFVPPPLSDGDRAALRALASSFPAFGFALTAVRRFPGVLWLAPDPAAPFVELTRRVVTRWPQHPPYAGAHAGDVPHLTVAHGADALFDGLEPALSQALPVHAPANALALVERDESGRWTVTTRFAFAGGAG